jgi:heme/copper-type cytochrome/quinol oxidase subunit 4
MNITREVVTDLLPVYFSGEASADTRALVEDYFRQNPDFERIARRAATPLETLKVAAWPGLLPRSAEAAKEKHDLECVRSELHRRRIFFGLALFFTLAPLAFVFRDGHMLWMMARNAPWDAAFYWTLAALLWVLYFARLQWRTFSLVIGIFFALLPALDILHRTVAGNLHFRASGQFGLLWETALFWGIAAVAWLQYFARLRLRTAALAFAIYLTLLPFPFILYPMLSGEPKVFSNILEPAIVWFIAAVVWLRYLFLSNKAGSDGTCH